MKIGTSKYTLPGAALLLSLLAGVVAYTIADGYIDRLPNHKGFQLVAVENKVRSMPATLPEKTFFILVDGLREDSARAMDSTRALLEHGQCRTTSTGELTISRPVYTVLSTGLEADRTGSRNNYETSPVAVQSIWEVAREARLHVHAFSNLSWWDQLFPSVFHVYSREPDESVNLLALAKPGDLTVIHPTRVDTAGHDHGADSDQYRAAVASIDSELNAFLGTLDLSKDVVIFTADHGHSATGGHGGPAPEISEVLTCIAGPGIESKALPGTMDARIIAPLIALRLGLAFPKHMLAGDDHLDEIFSMVSAESLGPAYLSERKADIETFRETNRAQIRKWLGDDGSWSTLYQRERNRHHRRWALVVLVLVAATLYSMRKRGMSGRQSLWALLWIAAVIGLSGLVYTLVRGSFDFTSINSRLEFRNGSLIVGLSVGLLGLLAHAGVWRSGRRLLGDQLTMLALLLAVDLAHLWIYGVPMGFPLPGPTLLFLPFICSALAITASILCGLLAIFVAVAEARRRQACRAQGTWLDP